MYSWSESSPHPEDMSKNNTADHLPVSVWITLIVGAGVTGYLAGNLGDHPPQEAVVRTAPPILRPASMPAADPEIISPGTSFNSHTISDLAASAGRSVVHIEVASKPPSNDGCPYFFGRQAHLPPGMMSQGRYASAAGVILRSDGHILTNAHVIRGADEIKVTLADGKEFMAQRVGQDDSSDLALLKITAPDLVAARFGDSTKVVPGEWAVAIGSPFHLRHSVSLGIVSALDRSIGEPLGGIDLIQTDAAINPGNSGGPLLNLNGEVIGLNCVVRADAQNISFAVPSKTVLKVAAILMKHGKIEHSYIGLKMQEQPPISLKDDQTRVMVTHSFPAGPGYSAGIRDGDMIKSINGKPTKKVTDIKKILHDTTYGTKMDVAVLRNGEECKYTVTLGKRPEPKKSH